MKLDLLAIAGIIVGIATIVAGNSLEGGSVSMLLNLPAALIVVGGTVGAVMLQTPGARLRRALGLMRLAFLSQERSREAVMKRLELCTRQYRTRGAISLEDQLQHEHDEFVRSSLELVAMDRGSQHVRAALTLDLEHRVASDLEAASVFHAMGGYAPTIGILGAVIGLIQVMSNLADPAELGPGIATAFVATIYGVGFANLILLPLAERLRQRVQAEGDLKLLWVEGLLAMIDGEHPSTLRLRVGVGRTVGCV